MDEKVIARVLSEVKEKMKSVEYGTIKVVLAGKASYVDIVTENRSRIPKDTYKPGDKTRHG